MAPQALVPRAVRPFGGHPSALPTQTEAVAAEPKCNVLPDVLPDVAEASVASFQEQPVKKGVPQGARQLALAAWRPGLQEPSGYIQHSTEFSVAGVVGSLKVPLRHL